MRPSEDRPGPHPPPPSDLAARELPIRITSQSWFRFHGVAHDPLYWGMDPPRRYPARFDDPDHEYGAIYVGADEHAAFIETLGHATALHTIGWADLGARTPARVDAGRPLQLVDLSGPGLARLGADARLYSGDYAVAGVWSRALWRHPLRPDGILYPSRHDPSRMCAMLYNRTALDLSAALLGPLTESIHRELLGELLRTYRFGLQR